MKRKISFILVLTIILSILLSLSVFAYKIGDVIGTSLTTDIVAQINGYDIASYNYQGYTYIVAEDLANYGFSVQYDNSTRTLGIYRNYGVTNIYSTYTKPAVSSKDVGKVAYKLLYTDIATYLDGTYVNSYNIDGKTIICFDDLAGYGTLNYDNNSRKLTLDIPGIAKNSLANPISAPFDTIEQMRQATYDVGKCYKAGNFYVGKNSADGIFLHWAAKNVTNKTIKYITVTFEFYNAVGDLTKEEITKKTSKTMKLTGPIEPQEAFYIADIIGYSVDCQSVKITNMKVDYMDGTSSNIYYGYKTERYRPGVAF